MSVLDPDWINDTNIKCWSCDEVMTRKDWNNNDGFCTECQVEMDISDEPYTNDEE